MSTLWSNQRRLREDGSSGLSPREDRRSGLREGGGSGLRAGEGERHSHSHRERVVVGISKRERGGAGVGDGNPSSPSDPHIKPSRLRNSALPLHRVV